MSSTAVAAPLQRLLPLFRSPVAAAAMRQQVRAYSAPGLDSIPPNKKKYVPTSGTYPKGFLVGSTHVGVKPSNTRFDDVALVVSEVPASAAAAFTMNKFKAGPVIISRDIVRRREGEGMRAVVVNSGCANAVTGQGGIDDARQMGLKVDECLGVYDPDNRKSSTLVMSTGVIGQRLPIDKILDGIPKAHAALGNTHDHWLAAARAICTTDTFPKLLSRTFTLSTHPGFTYTLTGMTKGAGMIHPNMATLLGIICTDAPVAPPALHSALRHAVNRSFNCISVDGDTSTNDTVAIYANGAAGGRQITHGDRAMYHEFQDVLSTFTQDLAQLVVRDGEGATKFVTIRVENALTFMDAKDVAATIARSPLVKTALYGKDANWGRILCAAGHARGGFSVVPKETSVSFIPTDGSEELKLLVNGEPQSVDEARAKEILEQEDLEILVRVSNRRGKGVTYWTCDLSHEYVTINGDYRT